MGFLEYTEARIIWNFWPTGHGKGLWDNEGYQLKRAAVAVNKGAAKYDTGCKLGNAKELAEWAKENMDPKGDDCPVKEEDDLFLFPTSPRWTKKWANAQFLAFGATFSVLPQRKMTGNLDFAPSPATRSVR